MSDYTECKRTRLKVRPENAKALAYHVYEMYKDDSCTFKTEEDELVNVYCGCDMTFVASYRTGAITIWEWIK